MLDFLHAEDLDGAAAVLRALQPADSAEVMTALEPAQEAALANRLEPQEMAGILTMTIVVRSWVWCGRGAWANSPPGIRAWPCGMSFAPASSTAW